MATGDKKRAVMTDDINNSGSSYPVLGPTGDGSNVTAAFTAASTRANISTGEKLSVIFGKVAKWFTDLGTAAFTTLDTSSLTDDNVHVPSSGVVKSAITSVESDLAGQHLTGSTNTTGATITAGTYFYLNDVLVRAKTSIAANAAFTEGTNYETITNGIINDALEVRYVNFTFDGTPQTAILKKSGGIVSAVIPGLYSIALNAWGNEKLFDIPNGFIPSLSCRFHLIRQNVTAYVPVYYVASSDGFKVDNQSGNSVSTGVILRTVVTWTTD